jgi:hypothetical protein
MQRLTISVQVCSSEKSLGELPFGEVVDEAAKARDVRLHKRGKFIENCNLSGVRIEGTSSR